MEQNNAMGKFLQILMALFFIFLSGALLYADFYVEREYLIQTISGQIPRDQDFAENVIRKVVEYIGCNVMFFYGLYIIIRATCKGIAKLDGTNDDRDVWVSHFRARRRIHSKRFKRNLFKMCLEFWGLVILGAGSLWILYYGIANRDVNNALVRFALNNSQVLMVVLVCSFFLSIKEILDHYTFIDNLRRISDEDFERIENEIDRSSTRIYPKSLYLTDNFIIKLHAGWHTGAKGKNDVDSFLVQYSDIEYVYPTSIGFENAMIHDNIGVAISGSMIGKKVIIRLSNSDLNQRYVYDIISQICKKNPGVSTEEKVQYAM